MQKHLFKEVTKRVSLAGLTLAAKKTFAVAMELEQTNFDSTWMQLQG